MFPSLKVLSPEPEGYTAACAVFADGGLVAFPTETVYGLGADARNDHAVARIFSAKERPRFNPLIVHVSDAEVAQRYVEWSDQAKILAAVFWPGPVTLVLPLKPDSGLSSLVTADLPTLAIRVPDHPVAQKLLTQFKGPVAAPSANPSGRISPTSAMHVLDGLGSRVDAIIDGGLCSVGLESTILTLNPIPTLLRQGGLPQEAIEAALGVPLVRQTTDTKLTAPGQMASHYAPNARVRLNARKAMQDEVLLGFGPMDCELNLSVSGDMAEAAANLFGHLHSLDAMRAGTIAVAPIPEKGLGRAINDRLRRAAAPRDI